MEQGVRLVLQWIEAVNRGDQASAQAFFAPECRQEGVPSMGPGARLEIDEIFGFGSRCILRWSIYGYADSPAPLFNAPRERGLDLFQIRNGLIIERLSFRSMPEPPKA